MSEYQVRLEVQKKAAKADYLNRLYHLWNVAMARWDHEHNADFLRIKFIEGKIEQETRRRREAGWTHDFCRPDDVDEWPDQLPDYISVCCVCDLHVDDDLETKWIEGDPHCPDCYKQEVDKE